MLETELGAQQIINEIVSTLEFDPATQTMVNSVVVLIDDGVEVAVYDRIHITPGELPRVLFEPGVQVESAAAALSSRHHHLAPVVLEDSNRRLIHLGKIDALHAPREKRHARAPRRFRQREFRELRDEVMSPDRRQKIKKLQQRPA